MSELQDFSLEPETSPTEESRERRSGRGPLWAVLAVLLVAIGAGTWLWCGREAAPPVDEAVVLPEAEERAEEAPEAPEVELPSMAESDGWLREVVTQLSARPELARWLATDRLIERFVAAVDNVGEGRTPKVHVPFLAPEGPFVAVEDGGRTIMDEASGDRYDRAVAVVASLHTQGTADLYNNLQPLFQQAYRNLGYPDGDFREATARAVRQVLTTPVPEAPVRLVPDGVSTWAYASPSLESLAPVQRQLLRLGPDNLRRVQKKVREIALAAGFSAARIGA